MLQLVPGAPGGPLAFHQAPPPEPPPPPPPPEVTRPSLRSAVSQSDAMAFWAAVRLTRPSHTAGFSALSTESFGFGTGGDSGHRLVASLLPPSSSGTRWSSSV